jgi:hypothetical protein
MAMTRSDREAMQRAIEVLRADPDCQIEAMLRAQPEEPVGLFAVGVLQVRNLKLRPWEAPPADTADVQTPRDVYGFRASEVSLLKRMLAAGVSRFAPNPLQALAAAAAKPAA